MEFTPMSAEQYRALSRDEFIARRNQVIDLLNADTLPEGVDLENLLAEADIISSEVELRNRQEAAKAKASVALSDATVAKRQDAAKAVIAGAGNVIETTEKRSADVRDVTDLRGFTSSREYRAALARHIMHIEKMPAEMTAKALQERSNTTVSMNADYSNMTSTFTNTFSGIAIAPLELSDEVISELHEHSVLYPKVNLTYDEGVGGISERDLVLTGAWIGDKETSPWQSEQDAEVFTWTWHQFEARVARTMLADALMRDNFKAQLAPELARVYGTAIDLAVLSGNGSTQPKGITNDVRLIGSDGKGKTTDGTPTTVGKALIITVNDDKIDDWKFWSTLLGHESFNRLYRGGELIVADGTWYNHIDVLHDDNNRPISNLVSINQGMEKSLRGVGSVDLLPNDVLKTFDNASAGDIIGIYGNFKGYTLNTQPGMPLTTATWDDYDTNTRKTRMLVACDGRVTNPYGWVILKKAAQG